MSEKSCPQKLTSSGFGNISGLCGKVPESQIVMFYSVRIIIILTFMTFIIRRKVNFICFISEVPYYASCTLLMARVR